MNTLKALLDEVLGMFVDDGSLAIAIMVIVAVAAWISISFENTSTVVGTILYLGCLVALVENVVRTTRNAEG